MIMLYALLLVAVIVVANLIGGFIAFKIVMGERFMKWYMTKIHDITESVLEELDE